MVEEQKRSATEKWSDVDPLRKREEFAVSLRKAKKAVII